MPYATRTDLEARLAPDLLALLGDDDADGDPDEGPLAAALEDAAALIDAGLGRRYVTPVVPTPALLRRWCVDLAVEQLLLRRREAMAPEHAARAAQTHAALEAIAGGERALEGAQPLLGDFAAEISRLEETAVFNDDELGLY